MAFEKLEVETYFGKCKCCFNYSYLKTMWEEHIVEDEPEIYGKMLTQCFSIPWTVQTKEEDDQICEGCVWKLREAHLFKKQVLQCQKEQEEFGADVALEIKSEVDNDSYIEEYLEEELLSDLGESKHSDTEEIKQSDESRTDAANDEESPVNHNDDDDDDDEDYSVMDNGDEDNINHQIEEDQNLIVLPSPRKRSAPQKAKPNDTECSKPKWPRKLPKEQRYKTYKQYTHEQMKHGMEAVQSGKLKRYEAADAYPIPRKTFQDKLRTYESAGNNRPSSDDETTEQDGDVMLTLQKHRENIRSVLAYSNATPLRGYWGIGFVCAFCPNQYADASALKCHTRTHGDLSKEYTVPHIRTHVTRLDISELKCRICNTKIDSLPLLMSHLKDHNKPIHFDVNNHLVPFKFDNGFECVECREQFKNFKTLSEHMSNTHHRNYVCEKCDRGFVNKVNLLSHKDTHKTGDFNCSYCNRLFSTLRRKTTHERLSHAVQTKSIKCDYCRKWFQNTVQKNNHELRAHKKQRISYKCDYCEKSYARQRTLHAHVNNDHLLERSYKCLIEGCDKAFFLNKTLKTHLITHDNTRLFPCTLCTKTYRSQKTLKNHMYEHNEKRVFRCQHCSKSYVHKKNLELHLKIKHR